jgi:hypothetical protein
MNTYSGYVHRPSDLEFFIPATDFRQNFQTLQFLSHYFITLLRLRRTSNSEEKITFLEVFAKLLKMTTNFVMSVCPSARMEQLGSHWTDFHEI